MLDPPRFAAGQIGAESLATGPGALHSIETSAPRRGGSGSGPLTI
jgi:hypothetical protein